MNFKRFAVAFLVLGLVCAVGCSKDKGYKKVTGKVTMGGQPVDAAGIMFWPQAAGGESGGGKTVADGSFTVTSSGAQNGESGLLPGEYKVTVQKYATEEDPDQKAFEAGEITYDELQERKAKKGSYSKSKGPELLTPEKFARQETTTITVTVGSDSKKNVFDINLDE